MAYPYDELDDDQMPDDSLELSPYDSISSRQPLPDTSSTAPNPQVKAAIQRRMEGPALPPTLGPNPPPAGVMPPPPMPGGDSDPFEKLAALRNQTTQSQGDNNLFQALSNLARGSSAPTDQAPLFANISKQHEDALKNATSAATMQAKVKAAIQAKQLQQDSINARQQNTFTQQNTRDDKDNAAKTEVAKIIADAKGNATDSKENSKTTKRFTEFSNKIDPTQARAGTTGKIQQMLNSADHVQGLLAQYPDGNLPHGPTREFATNVANLISGGGSTTALTQINELVPNSLAGSVMDKVSYLFNHPAGRQQQEFIKQLAETATRQQQISQNQLNRDLYARVGGYEDLRKADPEKFNTIMKLRGLDPQVYDDIKNGKKIPIVAPPASSEKAMSADDQAAVAWANAHKDDPRAQKILQLHGMK